MTHPTTLTNNNPPTTPSCCLNQPSNCRVESETPQVTAFLNNPHHQHPSRRHDIGVVRGVVINARATSDGMRIFPRVPYQDNHFPAYEQPTNTPIDFDKFNSWLTGHHTQAQVERNALRAADNMFQQPAPGHTHGRER